MQKGAVGPRMGKHSPVKMRYDINIVFAFVAVGAILLLTGSGSPIWGYSWLTLALTALLFTVVSQLIIQDSTSPSKKPGLTDLARSLWKYGTATAPITLLLALTSWYAGQYSTYADVIKNGDLPAEYYNFSHASTTVLVFEIIALYNMITDLLRPTLSDKPVNTKSSTYQNLLSTLQARDDTIFYGLILLSFVMAGFMHVILAYFITDG